MKTFVIDASVIIKWIFPERKDENHLETALYLLKTVKQDAVHVLQPPHWLVEVAGVVVRLQPDIIRDAINLLHAMEFSTIDTIEIYQTAGHLAKKFEAHLFDTLYHAVALHQSDAQFITADDAYYKKTFKQGSIIRLADFS